MEFGIIVEKIRNRLSYFAFSELFMVNNYKIGLRKKHLSFICLIYFNLSILVI